jgi:hypothetical protein
MSVGHAVVVEVGKARDLPAHADRAQGGGVGDVVVGDVVDLERAGRGAAQHHVDRVAVEEAAEAGKLKIGPHLAEQVGRQDGVVADVVNLVLAGDRGRAVRPAQDHGRGRAAGRRRVRLEAADKAMVLTEAVDVRADDLAGIVDAVEKGAARAHVNGGVIAAAVEEAMESAAGVGIIADDLA